MGQPEFLLLGVNHLTASVELRDRLLFGEEDMRAFAAALREGPAREVVVLSTCNRTEIYAIAEDPDSARARAESEWARLRKVDPAEIRAHGYHLRRGEAVRHLFRVIGSLDSLVLGETQILGQVKEAYQRAARNGWTDFFLNHLFQSGMHTGKRIHAETGVHEGAVSIAYAAVELARKVLGRLEGRTVGVVGAGEMGELAAQHLHKAGARRFRFFNRSLESAARLAAAFGGEVHPLPDLAEHLHHCDILVSATGSPDIVVTRAHAQAAASRRGGNPLFLMDIAAPRDIDPEAGEVNGIFLFTIDDLQSTIQENVDARRAAAQKALTIVEEEAAKVESWTQSLGVVPVLRVLREKYQGLADREVDKWAAGQPEEVRRQLEALGRGLLNKFLHDPCTRLKVLGEQGDGARAGYYAGLLFSLDREDKKDG